jgi:hypothetical protein
MQIIELELTHFNFFCPATGERILSSEECNDDAKSLMGYWLDEFLFEPYIKDKDLLKAWQKEVKRLDKLDASQSIWDEFESFLRNYNVHNWVVFKLTASGIACGPVSNTVWKVLNLDI